MRRRAYFTCSTYASISSLAFVTRLLGALLSTRAVELELSLLVGELTRL